MILTEHLPINPPRGHIAIVFGTRFAASDASALMRPSTWQGVWRQHTTQRRLLFIADS